MSVARTWGVALQGTEGAMIEVEADLTDQLPEFRIIGLGDKALAEAQLRVRNATDNTGLPLPRRRLTVNLSPASLPKQGAGFDVAIAIAALATTDGVSRESIARTVHIGELGLDGRLRPVLGVLPAVLSARRAGVERVVVPEANRAEAELVDGVHVSGAVSLADVARLHGADVEECTLDPVPLADAPDPAHADTDLGDIVGQADAVEALVTAAAGGHHLLMSGPPGCGKTMLAERLPGILPPLDDEAALEAAAVRSLAGLPVTRLDRVPPFEAPHHSASTAALVGGGTRSIRPGAIARASRGVLFLDEAAEFAASSLDALRQPLESGTITIHRSGAVASFPAQCQLVLATNPCPCGQFGVVGGSCSCAPSAVRRYLTRLSGPLVDRIDIELSLRQVRTADRDDSPRVTSRDARERVARARARATARWAGTTWTMNAQVPGAVLRSGSHALPATTRAPLDSALQRGTLTLRAYDRVLRVAWTIADLEECDSPSLAHIGRALYLKKGIAP